MKEKTTFVPVDASVLPKHFDSASAERRWDRVWDETGVYRWDPSRPRSETFVVDTPPPTVSGSLHVGHVFSYTHPDLVVRFQRMKGRNIFYPMGWDDNGLPTERRVQNFYHVRCEPHVAYEPDLELDEASAKQRKDPPRLISRKNFIALCDKLTAVDEKAFEELFRRLGLSVDWQETYATIDEHCRSLAQLSFIDLYGKGLVYQSSSPTMWDVDFHTAVAQAEVEERPVQGAFHHIEFGVEGSSESFVIATTRPELLPACVGVCAHPSDARYQDLFGKRAVTPLFRAPVPIFSSELADPDKGSGILMVCTFGDQTDVHWWRTEKLALRQLVTQDGRLADVEFGSEGYESLDPAAANAYYAELKGKKLTAAREKIVEQLRDPTGSATGQGAPLQREPEKITHPVKFFEKGDRPLEFLTTRQWFLRLVEKKQLLLDKGAQIEWHPSFMHVRYRDWTENLGLDWCLSRQRYFGVPIPVWFPIDAQGTVLRDQPILPKAEMLPIDPMSDVPPDYDAAQREQPGGFTGESDIFDTWFTSSLTPQIGSHWLRDPERHNKLFPADVRPQAHDIIRTWAFYTIAKAALHEDNVPWYHVMLSGWILDPDRKKMSKSKGNVVTPMRLFDEHGADAVRYWAANARLGADTAFDEKVFKIGRRLVTKIFNASKFVLAYGGDVYPVSDELDRAFLKKLETLVSEVTAKFEALQYAEVLSATESFFWSNFTDSYIELAKPRAWNADAEPAARGSAIAALRLALSVLVRLFAPFLPYITEEVYSWAFARETGLPSVHVAPWPGAQDFEGVPAPADPESFDLAVAALAVINKAKTEALVSTGRVVETLTLAANEATLARLTPVMESVIQAARAQKYGTVVQAELGDGAFEVAEIAFAPKASE
jgi:valyl-tRNA synthetase